MKLRDQASSGSYWVTRVLSGPPFFFWKGNLPTSWDWHKHQVRESLWMCFLNSKASSKCSSLMTKVRYTGLDEYKSASALKFSDSVKSRQNPTSTNTKKRQGPWGESGGSWCRLRHQAWVLTSSDASKSVWRGKVTSPYRSLLSCKMGHYSHSPHRVVCISVRCWKCTVSIQECWGPLLLMHYCCT